MTMMDSTERAYEVGRNEEWPNYHQYEIADAIKAWKKAESQHEHTSFYGLQKIRSMRAYWLGRMRTWRDNHVDYGHKLVG